MGPASAYAKQPTASWSLEQMLSQSPETSLPKGPGPPGPQDRPGHAWQAHESVGGRRWGRGRWAQGGEAESRG